MPPCQLGHRSLQARSGTIPSTPRCRRRATPFSYQRRCTSKSGLRVNDGDTYSTLARQYYSDESYAGALKQWNIKEGDTAEQRAGLLPPGGLVFIPEKDQLDARFPATGRLQYKVGPGNEEFLFAIAKKTLNRGDSWEQIASLNRSFNPAVPIPAGTILQMPAGAVVPPENKP